MVYASKEKQPAEHDRLADGHDDPIRRRAFESGSFAGVFARFERNAEIFGEDQPADHFYRVISGGVRIVKLVSDGRRQITSFCLPGDMFGFEDSVHRFCAETVSESNILIRKRNPSLARSMDDPRMVQQLWTQAVAQLQRAQHHVLLLGRKTAQERLADFLLDMVDRGVRQDGVIELPMSRQDIADYLGLTIETVSRTLTQLARDQIISIPASRRIVVRNRSALERISETYAA